MAAGPATLAVVAVVSVGTAVTVTAIQMEPAGAAAASVAMEAQVTPHLTSEEGAAVHLSLRLAMAAPPLPEMRTGELEEAVWARAEPTQPGREAEAVLASAMIMATVATAVTGASEEEAAEPVEAEVAPATAATVGPAASAAGAVPQVQAVVRVPRA